MKKKYRKDVIIARIIFAGIILVLIAIIVGIVMLVKSKTQAPDTQSESTQTQQEQLYPYDSEVVDSEIDSEAESETESETELETETDDEQQNNELEENTTMWTTTQVNFRTKPNTSCEVITVLKSGREVTYISDDNGWAYVERNGQKGYIKMEYLTTVKQTME